MSKMRRKLSLGLCALLVCGSYPIFLGAEHVPEELIKAEEYAEQIFAVNEDRSGYLDSYFVKGLDEEEDYILVERSTGGYVVFEREDYQMIEYSPVGYSPYQKINKEKAYYAGPTNYFKETSENEVEHLKDKKSLKKDDGKKIAKDVKTKIKADKEKKKKEKEEKKKQRQEELDALTNSQTIESGSLALSSGEDVMSSPGITGPGGVAIDRYTVVESTYISDCEYFLVKPRHGINENGTCVTIATQLLIGFNDWAKDGRIITNPDFMYDPEGIYANQPLHQNTISTSSENDEENGKISLYEQLLEYIDRDENGAYYYDAEEGIKKYLSYYVPADIIATMAVYHDFDPYGEGFAEKIKEEIDNDRACIASINLYMENSSGNIEVGGHSIVAYGYQTFSVNGIEVEGIITHFGWGEEVSGVWLDDDNCIWVNSDWIKGYVGWRVNHTHTWDSAESHIVQCTICGARKTVDDHFPLNIEGLPAWHYEQKINYNNQGEGSACPYYCYKVCECGYKQQWPHDFEFVALTGEIHSKICRNCGYGINENHFFKREACFYCSYVPVVAMSHEVE